MAGLVPLGVSALLLLVVQPVFLGFLAQPDDLADGLQGIVLRLGIVLVGAVALDVYTALIRSPSRAVYDLHPVDAGQVVRFEVGRTALARWWMVPAAGVLLLPVLVAGHALGYGLALVALVGVWLLALTGSALTHLGAVWAAEAPAMEPLLDAVRGSNPRAQAAFLYAPGAALAACGGAVWLASVAVGQGAVGELTWLPALAVPFVFATLAWLPLARLGNATWARASAVLSDIDARYAVIEGESDDALRVYLDWSVRFVPNPVRRYLLKDLRHGWRLRRTLITLSWLVAALGALAGWSVASASPLLALTVGVFGVAVVASNGVLMERDQPAFLRQWMPPDVGASLLARGLAVFLWLQVAIWLPLPVLWLRHGLGDALVVSGGIGLAALGTAALAALCSRRPSIGLWLYLSLAATLVTVLLSAARLGVLL